MSRLTERKTRLVFETGATLTVWGTSGHRHLKKERAIVVEVMNPYYASVRLAGTRTRYEISFASVYEHAARLHAERVRAERKAARKAARRQP